MTKFDIKKSINKLVESLSDRSRDIVLSRFGVGRADYETLEAIGQRYGITRERVRQIEADALRHIQSSANEPVFRPIVSALYSFIKANGGVMEEEVLRAKFAVEFFETKPEPIQKYEGATMLFANLGRTGIDETSLPTSSSHVCLYLDNGR